MQGYRKRGLVETVIIVIVIFVWIFSLLYFLPGPKQFFLDLRDLILGESQTEDNVLISDNDYNIIRGGRGGGGSSSDTVTTPESIIDEKAKSGGQLGIFAGEDCCETADCAGGELCLNYAAGTDCGETGYGTCCLDSDGDGYYTTAGCGTTIDCDDDNATLNYDDADGDGVTSCDGDCDDDDYAITPGKQELCDGKDNDCDGTIDEGTDEQLGCYGCLECFGVNGCQGNLPFVDNCADPGGCVDCKRVPCGSHIPGYTGGSGFCGECRPDDTNCYNCINDTALNQSVCDGDTGLCVDGEIVDCSDGYPTYDYNLSRCESEYVGVLPFGVGLEHRLYNYNRTTNGVCDLSDSCGVSITIDQVLVDKSPAICDVNPAYCCGRFGCSTNSTSDSNWYCITTPTVEISYTTCDYNDTCTGAGGGCTGDSDCGDYCVETTFYEGSCSGGNCSWDETECGTKVSSENICDGDTAIENTTYNGACDDTLGCIGGTSYKITYIEDCSAKDDSCGSNGCAFNEKPVWSCSDGACDFYCNYDASCLQDTECTVDGDCNSYCESNEFYEGECNTETGYCEYPTITECWSQTIACDYETCGVIEIPDWSCDDVLGCVYTCLESGTCGYIIQNLDAQLDVIDEPTQTENFESVPQTGSQTGILKKSSTKIGTFDISFTQNWDWSDVVSDTGTYSDSGRTLGRALLHIPASHTEVSNKKLYIPASLNTGLVYVCPDATSFEGVTESCSGLHYYYVTAVSGLYEVSVSGTGGAETLITKLDIWDDTDAGMPYVDGSREINQDVDFFANFTNRTSGLPITGAGVWCNISLEDVGGGWIGPFSMAYNGAHQLYEYTRSGGYSAAGTYDWNVTCDGTSEGYDQLNATDDVTIQPLGGGGVIPEFSIFGIFLALMVIFVGVYWVKVKKK